jgi:hypothetical protein
MCKLLMCGNVPMCVCECVSLQNCHLARSWMPQLVKLVEEIGEAAASVAGPDTAANSQRTGALTPNTQAAGGGAAAAPAAPTQGYFVDLASGEQQQQQQQVVLHPNFRLWLTSSPVDFFPPGVLHRGLALYMEPPRGLKQGLLGTYASLPGGYLAACDSSGRGQQWRALVFAGALLHGLLCERRRFGALGWNVPYEFSDEDLSCALANIQVGVGVGGCRTACLAACPCQVGAL